jgi:general secretion pathway protein J
LRQVQSKKNVLRGTRSPCCEISRSGFTLIELTISIALIGIIILVVAGTLRLGYRSVESGEKRIESLERIRSSLNIVDAQIQSFVPLSYEDEGEKKYYFKGERGLLQFSTNYSIWGGEKGYVIVTYTITTAENGKQILSASETVVGMGSGRETKLFTNFDTISFAYYFKDPAEEQGKWAEQMTEEDSLPEKVALRLTEGARDFTMVIPLRAAMGLEDQIVSSPVRKGN